MTEPRIGDTVHYAPDQPGLRCEAAIIVGQHNFGPELQLRVLSGYAPQDDYNTWANRQDPSFNETGDFTPGTWHHIH